MLCVCILASVIQHAKRMRCIMLSSVACLTLPYFSHYLIKDIIFEKKKIYIYILKTNFVF